MSETQRRLQRERRTVPVMWAAITMAMAGMVTSCLALMALAGGETVFWVVMAIVTVGLFGGAYGFYRFDRKTTEDPSPRRDIVRARRAKYLSAYGRGRRGKESR